MKHPCIIFCHQDAQVLRAQALHTLRQTLCPTPTVDGCFCAACSKLREQQHAAVIWLERKTVYLKDDAEIIAGHLQFVRNADQPLFIIIQNPENFSQQAANSLLKIFEEPPKHHYIMMFSQNIDAVLPTIASRSRIQHLADSTTGHLEPDVLMLLAKRIITQQPLPIAEFDKIISKASTIPQDSLAAVQKIAQENLTLTQAQRTLLFWGLENPPAQGSAKTFWRTLYLKAYADDTN